MISVCLACFNGSKFIKIQVESILDQLGSEDELIISDDHSSDHTIAIIEAMNDSRIKIFYNESTPGVAGNFAHALSHAQGDYIFLSDQDDIWNKNKVTTVVQHLDQYDCVLHNAELINAFGASLGTDLFSIYQTRAGYAHNLFRNTFVGCCMAFRKELLASILPIPKTIKMHDMWIALLAELKGSTKLVDENLIQYRRHELNASTTSNKSGFSKTYQLKYRMQMFFYTIKRILK